MFGKRRRPRIDALVQHGDAAGLIAALGYHDDVTDTTGRLYDLGAVTRRDAARALASVEGDAEVGPALIRSLGDNSAEVRAAVATTLAARQEKRAVPALVDALLTSREEPGARVRAALVRALSELAAPDTAELVVRELIAQPSPPEAAAIVQGMARRGGDETLQRAVTTASAILRRADHALAQRASEVLVWLGPASLDPLLDALELGAPARLAAIAALGRLGDLRASDRLAPLVEDGDVEIRRAATRALVELADPTAAPALMAMTLDEDQQVRASALAGLQRLGPVAPPSSLVPHRAGTDWS